MSDNWLKYWDHVNLELYALIKQVKKNRYVECKPKSKEIIRECHVVKTVRKNSSQ